MPEESLPLSDLEQPRKYLTGADLESIIQFFRTYTNEKFRFDPEHGLVTEGLLYHYTTGDNLIRIIESQEIWCTQLSCLNDTTEFVYAVSEFQKRVRSRTAAPHDVAIDPFLDRLEAYLSSPDPATVFLFVTCFSEHGDDLSQWRAYAGGERGYAIRFDPLKLYDSATSGDSTSQVLLRVEYDPQMQDTILNDVLKQGEEFFLKLEGAKQAPTKDWTDEFVRHWLWNLQYLAPCLKHPKFASEQEWRLVYPLSSEDTKRMQFKQRQSTMTRHVPLRLNKPLPIGGVLVGPCRYPQLSKIAVGDLLRKWGYDPNVVTVDTTEVPYRAI